MKTSKNPTEIVVYPIRNSPNNILVSEEALSEVGQVLQELMMGDYSENTKTAVVADISNFFRWYMDINSETFSFTRCLKRDCVDYKHSLIEDGKAPATINRRLSHIKIFFYKALELDFISKNPMQGVKQLPRVQGAPKALSPMEFRKYMKEVDIRGNIRDKVIIECMAYAGLRCGEVVRLQNKHISLSERSGKIEIQHSKGNKTRIVPIPLKLRETFQEFYEEYPPMNREDFLCQGQRGELTESGIAKMIDAYGSLANVVTHPHSFRHTFATNFLKNNPGELVALSQLLGHSNINTTALYTQQSLDDLQAKMDTIL